MVISFKSLALCWVANANTAFNLHANISNWNTVHNNYFMAKCAAVAGLKSVRPTSVSPICLDFFSVRFVAAELQIPYFLVFCAFALRLFSLSLSFSLLSFSLSFSLFISLVILLNKRNKIQKSTDSFNTSILPLFCIGSLVNTKVKNGLYLCATKCNFIIMFTGSRKQPQRSQFKFVFVIFQR